MTIAFFKKYYRLGSLSIKLGQEEKFTQILALFRFEKKNHEFRFLSSIMNDEYIRQLLIFTVCIKFLLQLQRTKLFQFIERRNAKTINIYAQYDFWCILLLYWLFKFYTEHHSAIYGYNDERNSH